MTLTRWFSASLLLALLFAKALAAAPGHFFLRNGDRVVFYGDSITEQRFYTTEVQAYVQTRFPQLHVKFVTSAVGGDHVLGGWTGPINLRLSRDVFPFKPNVVTIMLGMNDAWYQPFQKGHFGVFKRGYIHIIKMLQSHLPGVKIVLIEPSPYDDVTQKPNFPGGYNAVLLRYAVFVRQLAAQYHLMCVNFNGPMVRLLQKADKINPAMAARLIPGRVHPSASAQLVMAQTLLQAWHASATVTAVDISAAKARVLHVRGATVTHLVRTKNTISWTQTDRALPLPVMALHDRWPQFAPWSLWPAPVPDMRYSNPLTAMVVKISHFYSTLDTQSLQVEHLAAPRYKLIINGAAIGLFTRAQLTHGINLACYNTPMLAQAYHLLHLIWKQADLRIFAWRHVQLVLEEDHHLGIVKLFEPHPQRS